MELITLTGRHIQIDILQPDGRVERAIFSVSTLERLCREGKLHPESEGMRALELARLAGPRELN